jgi:hypothetical protein
MLYQAYVKKHVHYLCTHFFIPSSPEMEDGIVQTDNDHSHTLSIEIIIQPS